VLVLTYSVTPQTPAGHKDHRLVLQQNDGELRTRRPRDVASPSSEFLLKISPQINGSKHLFLGTEEIPPGATIPKHKHHGEEEALFMQTGRAHVWLGNTEYDTEPGAVVFIPAETSISLKNIGTDNIRLLFVFSDPAFERMMRCASVPKGQPAPPMSRADVAPCYHHGDAELE
jgi:quercetin dioxygenase-like cupin family protein